MKNILLSICFLFVTYISSAQDTVTFMYYNILNYSPSNPENTKNMKGIVHYNNPDIFAVNEISDDTSAKHILEYVLNTDTSKHFKKAVFTEGPDTDNMLFFNSDKFSLYSQDTILTALRTINEYILYYNDSSYISQHDTVFFSVYSAHLKASTGSTNEQDRYQEVLKFKNHLNENPERKNIFFGGDLNFYGNIEPALIELLSPGNYQLNDPLDSIGNWHDNPLYSHIHTQSTRFKQFGGGASGGLDDRFDFILVSNDLIQGSNQMKYIPGTYEAFGNDGLHFDDSLTSLPLNPGIPDSITYNLYYMSDHLPVIMKVYLNFDAAISEFHNGSSDEPFLLYPNPSSGNLIYAIKENSTIKTKIEIYSSTGQLQRTYNFDSNKNGQKNFEIKNLDNGIYFVKITAGNITYLKKIVVI